MDKLLLGAANKRFKPTISLLECEKEQIRIIAAQLKMQRGEIRHFQRLIRERIRGIEGRIPLEQKPKKQGAPSRHLPGKKTEQNARKEN